MCCTGPNTEWECSRCKLRRLQDELSREQLSHTASEQARERLAASYQREREQRLHYEQLLVEARTETDVWKHKYADALSALAEELRS